MEKEEKEKERNITYSNGILKFEGEYLNGNKIIN